MKNSVIEFSLSHIVLMHMAYSEGWSVGNWYEKSHMVKSVFQRKINWFFLLKVLWIIAIGSNPKI